MGVPLPFREFLKSPMTPNSSQSISLWPSIQMWRRSGRNPHLSGDIDYVELNPTRKVRVTSDPSLLLRSSASDFDLGLFRMNASPIQYAIFSDLRLLSKQVNYDFETLSFDFDISSLYFGERALVHSGYLSPQLWISLERQNVESVLLLHDYISSMDLNPSDIITPNCRGFSFNERPHSPFW